jgi:endonuclease YncB( thermonuclease family)
MVFGQSVTIESSGKDRYGRTLGTVFSQSKGDVNAELIRMGMAWHYRQYSQSTALQGFEDYARENKIGLWADPNPIPPRHLASRQALRGHWRVCRIWVPLSFSELFVFDV